MISVETALGHLFDLANGLGTEHIPLSQASGRVLALDVFARREQPPFAASAMDGYAVDVTSVKPGATFMVIGEAAAGHRFTGTVGTGEAVRIFTGAPLPAGTNRVVIQEDVTRTGQTITIGDRLDTKSHVRPAGGDFHERAAINAPRLLNPSDIALLAAMNIAEVPVTRRPDVAIIATGDELVQPGELPGPDQIIASNSYGLAALLRQVGAHPRLLPIAKDDPSSLKLAFDLAKGADLIITIGGASVGDHDIVGDVAQDLGMDRSFYKIAMRPGKPLMAGQLGDAMMIGLPGNPVSAMVCGHIFVVPVIQKMLRLGAAAVPRQQGPLVHDIAQNGPREHYMRALRGPDGITVFERQDSALLSVLSQANCLVVRPIDDPAHHKGDMVTFINL